VKATEINLCHQWLGHDTWHDTPAKVRKRRVEKIELSQVGEVPQDVCCSERLELKSSRAKHFKT
jgi:hypothetical protein